MIVIDFLTVVMQERKFLQAGVSAASLRPPGLPWQSESELVWDRRAGTLGGVTRAGELAPRLCSLHHVGPSC